jgi:hypothetical protein
MRSVLVSLARRAASRRVRAALVTVALFAAGAFLAYWTHRITPIQHWLAWRYVAYWASSLTLLASCTVAGVRLLELLVRRYFGFGEHVVLSAALGVLAFASLWFALGVLHLYSVWTFALSPLALLAFGANATRRWLGRYRRHRGLRGTVKGQHTGLRTALRTYGVLALGLLYFPILSPDNIAYDARWYHLATAERYAVMGGISRFPEGWFLGTYPQLATWLYSYAFSSPARLTFDKVELAAHLEFVLFLFSVFSIPVVVRRILGGRHQAMAWVARLLFPGVFLYDSSLAGGADHVASIWAAPIFLSFLRAYQALKFRECILFACCAGGALLTKYSVAGMVVFPGVALVLRALFLAFRARRGGRAALKPVLALVVTLVAGLVVTSSHWLKNWIWYRNPVYPLAYDLFRSKPWTTDSPDRFGHFMPTEWYAPRTWAGVVASLKATLSFAFVPNDWPMFHGHVPVFGFLLTLSLPALLFIRPRKRLFALVACTHVAIAVWYWMFHQDRYLQSLVPWMAAVVACIGIEVWRLGLGPRIGVVLLVALQLAWGGDTPFIPGHVMNGGTPYQAVITLLSSSYRKDFERRFETYAPFERVKEHVRPGGKLLIHEQHLHLGMAVPVVSDWIGWQGGISYVRMGSPAQIYASLQRMGVSDVLWSATSKGYDSLGGDLAFYSFVTSYTRATTSLGGQTLSRLVERLPDGGSAFQDKALVLGCGDLYASGLYRLSDLSVTVLAVPRKPSDFPKPRAPVPAPNELAGVLSQVDALAVNRHCFRLQPRPDAHGLERVAERQGFELWVRRAQVP